jgi:hypothetical protein
MDILYKKIIMSNNINNNKVNHNDNKRRIIIIHRRRQNNNLCPMLQHQYQPIKMKPIYDYDKFFTVRPRCHRYN